METYLVSNFKYRQAITRLKVSSHDLMIEMGRHGLNRREIEDRLCPFCNSVETEIHFLVSCPLYSNARQIFYRDIELDAGVINNASPDAILYESEAATPP